MHRLLIAEDLPFIASHIECLAQDAGVDVVAIVDSIEGARAAIGFAPDVAFIDLNLSDGFTGPQVADELHRLCNTRVIYLTANPDLLPEAVRSCHRVLRKPLVSQEVLAALLGPALEVNA